MKNIVTELIYKKLNKFINKECYIVDYKQEKVLHRRFIGIKLSLLTEDTKDILSGHITCVTSAVEVYKLLDNKLLKEYMNVHGKQITVEHKALFFNEADAKKCLAKFLKAKKSLANKNF